MTTGESSSVQCLRCGSARVVKNGRPSGRQRYRCLQCGVQFKECEARGVAPEIKAEALEMLYAGRSTRETKVHLQSMFGHVLRKMSNRTVQLWGETYTKQAVEMTSEIRVPSFGPWVVDHASLSPQDGDLWQVLDIPSGFLLGAAIGDSGEVDGLKEAVRKALRTSSHPPPPMFTFCSTEFPVYSDKYEALAEAVREELYWPSLFRPSGAASDLPRVLRRRNREIFPPFRYLRSRQRFRSREAMKRYLDGWVVIYNFMIEDVVTVDGRLQGRTPSDYAGMEAPFRSWLDVVKVVSGSSR